MLMRYLKLQNLMIAVACVAMVLAGSWFGISLLGPSVATLKDQCREAVESRDWKSAEEISAHWASVAPNTGEPWLQLAEALRRQQKFQLAFDCLNRVPPLLPESETALIAQIELQFGPLNHPEAGAEICEKVLAANPKSTIAQQRLIFFLTFTLQRVRLIHQIRSAMQLETEPMESYVYLFLVDSLSFQNGAELNSRWLKNHPDSELYEVAEAIFISEILDLSVLLDDVEGALATRRAAAKKTAVLEKLLAKYPHNAELLAYNIRQLIQTGDVANVVRLMAQATVDCEEDPRFWRFKGWVHAQRGQNADAENSYRRAIEINPLDWITRHMLAELLQQEQRFDEVKLLRELVARGNKMTGELRHSPNAREIAPEILSRLADYGADCGDKQMSDSLHKRIQRGRKQ